MFKKTGHIKNIDLAHFSNNKQAAKSESKNNAVSHINMNICLSLALDNPGILRALYLVENNKNLNNNNKDLNNSNKSNKDLKNKNNNIRRRRINNINNNIKIINNKVLTHQSRCSNVIDAPMLEFLKRGMYTYTSINLIVCSSASVPCKGRDIRSETDHSKPYMEPAGLVF